MSMVNELYASVYERLKAVQTKYENAENQLQASKEQDEVAKQKRIENLQLQLKKIDEYEEKVGYFKQMAEKHMVSKNLLTITPRELNFNRLRNWAMMIDPAEPDDPYAQRIYVQAKCNEMFLAHKKAEFQRTLSELTEDGGAADQELEKAVTSIKAQLVEECRAIIESEAFDQLASAVSQRHGRYLDNPAMQAVLDHEQDMDGKIGLGIYAQALPVLEELKYAAKAKLGEHFDLKGYILLPVEHALDKEMLISVHCAAAKEKKLYRGIQNYLLNMISRTAIGTRKICFLDALHFNSTALGVLRPLENSIVIDAIPKDSEAVVDKLKEIVSSFSDIDEALGMADSVQELNASAAPADQLGRTVLVLIGYPSAFSGEAKEYIKRILLNYEHYGISPILIDTQFVEKKDEREKDILADIVDHIYRIQMTRQREIISQNNGSDHYFKWYELTRELNESFITNVRSHDVRANSLGTEYVNRVDMENFPPYERGKKSIVLPYGVDSKDEMHSISFDNESFASYLMGASGSGKSTLLHTLITGILRNYHPDDVELWLADFKMSEFAQYIDPLPPHVKYILLDESPELVYDLLDQLTEKMMERQRFFMKHRDMKKVENVPSSIYMPVIFVILDEFSIMSQAVAESEPYKLKLQNLLAKGRALGIKFIFSSQTFTKGVAGLTQTAKDQIQTRIAMKNSYNEINETLELSSGTRTEQVKNWMEALPPHFTLSKYRDGERLQVKRLQVMYFKGKGDEALEPQRRLIRHLNRTMRKVNTEEYDNTILDAYVDKKPVIVDGNSFKAFNSEKIGALISEYRDAHSADLADDDTVITFGAPRRMVNAKFAVISNESRENLLLIARSAEQACGMSIMATAMKSFILQGGTVHVWAYNKNRLYRSYRDSHLMQYDVAEGMSRICAAISEIRNKLARKETGNDLIVMLGMEQICNDFDLIDFGGVPLSTSRGKPAPDAKQYEASSEEDLEQFHEVKDLSEQFKEQYDLDLLEDKWLDEGKSFEEIEIEEERLYQEFLARMGVEIPVEPIASEDSMDLPMPNFTESEDSALLSAESDQSYNALEDFKYIVKQGSRFGYHFMLCLSDLSDLKTTHLQQELFRHKMVFQISADDSIALFASKIASRLPEHICQYSDSMEQYSLRPFIHEGISWDGWDIDSHGEAVNSMIE